ncbi:hypothetical protein ACFS3C_00615 [Azotobacter vinelandii]
MFEAGEGFEFFSVNPSFLDSFEEGYVDSIQGEIVVEYIPICILDASRRFMAQQQAASYRENIVSIRIGTEREATIGTWVLRFPFDKDGWHSQEGLFFLARICWRYSLDNIESWSSITYRSPGKFFMK